MALTIDGLISKINTTQILQQLIAVERAPQDRLVNQRASLQSEISAYQGINSLFATVRSTAQSLSTSSGWASYSATSSSTSVSASAGPSATNASLAFTVDRLASTHTLVSSVGVGGPAAVVTSGDLLLTRGLAPLGIRSAANGGGLTLGAHTIAVTQASAGATATGTAAPAASTTITAGVDDTLDVTIDGVAQTFTLAAGTYSAEQLASALETASAGALDVSIDGAGVLTASTTHEGSAASLQVTGGTARAALGLDVDASAHVGTDGVVTVDGTATTVTDVAAGGTLSVPSGTGGTVDLVFGGGLRAGSVTGKNVSTGDGSLSSVVSAINGAGVGMTASVIQTGPAAYRLQLASTASGTAGALGVATDAFSGLGTLQTLSAAQDAQITVGTGPAAFSVTSSTNTISNLLPGVTFTVSHADPLTTVTVDVHRDADALATKVQSLVDAANAVSKEIAKQSAVGAGGKGGGVLLGDATARRLRDSLGSVMTNAVGSSSLGSPGLAGVSITRDGSFTFDRTKFLNAYATDPSAVEALFRAGATATDTHVQFAAVSAATVPGAYAVTVTRAAERAVATGAVVASLSASETIDVRIGTRTASFTAAAGSAPAAVAAGLNVAFASQSVGVVASVEGGALVLRSAGYGSAATFEVRSSAAGAGQSGVTSSAGVWESHAGVDVAGTIGGIAATGNGQVLSGPASSPPLAGLALVITATAADVAASTNFGTLTYTPGVAARVDTLGRDAIDSVSGLLTTAVQQRQSQVKGLDARISEWDDRLTLREQRLRAQFTAMESAMAQMQAQQSYLSNAINQLAGSTTSNG